MPGFMLLANKLMMMMTVVWDVPLFNPQGHHLSSKLKTPKTRNRKVADTEVYKEKSDVIGY